MNFIKTTKFDLMNNLKNPIFFTAYLFFPLLLLIGLSYLTRNSYSIAAVSSVDFYGITMNVFLCLFIAQLLIHSFTDGPIKSVNMRVIYSPTSKASIYMSKMVSCFLYGSFLFAIFTLFETLILKVNFGGSNTIYIIIANILFLFFMCALGTFICCIITNGDAATKVMTIICILFAGLGGAFIPLGHFGKVTSMLSNLSPIKLLLKCDFAVIYSNDFSLYGAALLFFAIASAALIALCHITFKPEEYI